MPTTGSSPTRAPERLLERLTLTLALGLPYLAAVLIFLAVVMAGAWLFDVSGTDQRADQIANGWERIRVGMTLGQVEQLVGIEASSSVDDPRRNIKEFVSLRIRLYMEVDRSGRVLNVWTRTAPDVLPRWLTRWRRSPA